MKVYTYSEARQRMQRRRSCGAFCHRITSYNVCYTQVLRGTDTVDDLTDPGAEHLARLVVAALRASKLLEVLPSYNFV